MNIAYVQTRSDRLNSVRGPVAGQGLEAAKRGHETAPLVRQARGAVCRWWDELLSDVRTVGGVEHLNRINTFQYRLGGNTGRIRKARC